MEKKNVVIAKKLLALAKELVASKSVKAYGLEYYALHLSKPSYVEALNPDGQKNWKRVDSYQELMDLCKGIDTNASACSLLRKDGERFFKAYGAPFYVYVNAGKPEYFMHESTHQIKNIMSDATVTDESVLRSAAGFLYDEILTEEPFASESKKFTLEQCKDINNWKKSERDAWCKGDFQKFAQYYAEADKQWEELVDKTIKTNQSIDDYNQKAQEVNKGISDVLNNAINNK